uniref:Uncharacterized protein n=1 Tax=Ascaris lumbricoides TaxID=6252 RepID=A0A0M3HH22_ASCLU
MPSTCTVLNLPVNLRYGNFVVARNFYLYTFDKLK